MANDFDGFSLGMLHFLNDLSNNNNRDWFQKNKPRYEKEVLEPSLDFIRAIEKPLHRISPHFLAVPKRVGGSLMRIYRDTRFAADKTPYKTNVGIHFRHEVGKDVHAPGFYFHIEPESVFLGAGIWHPDSATLKEIRAAMDAEPPAWQRVKKTKAFRESFQLAGDSLKRPPKGFDADHPLIEDLKRKDFIAVKELDSSEIFEKSIVKLVTDAFRSVKPLVKFLCHAIDVPF